MKKIVYPAIDLSQNKIVRLFKGDFSKVSFYSDDPISFAKTLRESGILNLHIIDLDGAKLKRPVHLNILREISSLGFRIQYGGGLRTLKDLEMALECGATYLLVGSMVSKKDEFKRAVSLFGSSLRPALDVGSDTSLKTEGWQKKTALKLEDTIKRIYDLGLKTFLVTATEKDGTLSGPDFSLYRGLSDRLADLDVEVIAAGGISSIDDVVRLFDIPIVKGCVVGKAFYEGRISIDDIKLWSKN